MTSRRRRACRRPSTGHALLLLLNLYAIDSQVAGDAAHILLKYQSDITKADKELGGALDV